MIINNDCLMALKELPENSVDAIITDPPYGLSFMGKKWDYDVPSTEIWSECLRVLKPGGYLLAFAGTRTQHRMAVNIEDAGFEIRDMIAWVYASGFPKSLNIGKAVDKLQGNEREPYERPDFVSRSNKTEQRNSQVPCGEKGKYTKGTSEWEGWGTALKPALEPITVARKPIEGNVAQNCLKWGVGGINIDESRVGMSQEDKEMLDAKASVNNNGVNFDVGEGKAKGTATPANNLGRFPANLIHDNSEEVRECFPDSKSPAKRQTNSWFPSGEANGVDGEAEGYGDTGNASRFFKSIIYQAKASKSERGTDNKHPTVKPIKLMEYLVKLVSREGQVVLDPFLGSGTTAIACKNLNRNCIGIERDAEYVKISEARISAVK